MYGVNRVVGGGREFVSGRTVEVEVVSRRSSASLLWGSQRGGPGGFYAFFVEETPSNTSL